MTRRNLFEQDLEDQKKEEEEKLLLDNVGFYGLQLYQTSTMYKIFSTSAIFPFYCIYCLFKRGKHKVICLQKIP